MEKLDFIDLHIHSIYSDGELNINELFDLALKNNVGVLSITDHDTLLGNYEIEKIKNQYNSLNVISGIELSSKIDIGRMHILGYGIDIYDENLNKKMIELRNNSMYSILDLITQLKKDYNIIFNTEDILNILNSNHNLGRPDLAKLCVKYKYADSIEDAFFRYLNDAYKKTKSTNKGIPYEECIDLILKSGGIPVLAHPKTLNRDYKELLILVKKMISYGLQGIEVYHSIHNNEDVKKYLSIALKENLLISGGSDYHGPSVKPDIELGMGKNNNLKIKKLSIVDRIN